jgi:TolB-like protein/DNA-binding winged helix-turn-helix (wHTH) protein/tetratricopeptide (TPR) repeat protein
MAEAAPIYRFGPYELRLRTRELYKAGTKLRLRPQPFQILSVLVERAGDVVTREELRELLWSAETFVDFEHGLNTSIKELRGVLSDSASEHRYIETLPRLGYRLIVPVEVNQPPLKEAIAQSQTADPGNLIGQKISHDRMPRPLILQRWPSLVGVSIVLIGALAVGLPWLWHLRNTELAASANGGIRSLAVLPLENFSGNPEQDYLSDGMTEALIARLSAIHGLRVISRTSAMQYKGTRKSVPAIGKELNVDAVIEGSVLRSEDKIRVTVQMIRADTDEHLWSGTYDRELQDVLALQSDVTQGIAHHIEIAVGGSQRGSPVAPRTVAPDVYEGYLKGRFALHKNSRAGLEEALLRFQSAVDEDGSFAPAYVGLAAAYSELGTVFFGASPLETRPKVLFAARKALELDPELVEARILLANALQKDWHWAEAEAEYRRAIELSPSDAGANAGLADWLLCQGRTAEALASARRAQELDPLAFDNTQVGWILFQARRYDEAILQLQGVLAVKPNSPSALWDLGFALIGAGRFDEAIATLEKAASLSDRSPAVLGVLVRAYASAGRRAEALRLLKELHWRRQSGYVPTGAFLNAYLGLGDREEAFVWLERAAEERSNIMQFLTVHPFFDPLRGDPRFAEFLRRANFSPKQLEAAPT